jgi:hypothetical protein
MIWLRLKRALANGGYYLLAVVFLWFVMSSIVGWFVNLPGIRREPQEGERCGPGYRWTRVGSLLDSDMSCEKE